MFLLHLQSIFKTNSAGAAWLSIVPCTQGLCLNSRSRHLWLNPWWEGWWCRRLQIDVSLSHRWSLPSQINEKLFLKANSEFAFEVWQFLHSIFDWYLLLSFVSPNFSLHFLNNSSHKFYLNCSIWNIFQSVINDFNLWILTGNIWNDLCSFCFQEIYEMIYILFVFQYV